MMHQTRKTRREHPFVSSGLSASPADAVTGWLTAENVAGLMGFYSAQWSHLAALEDVERWQRSIPARPTEARAAELRELFHRLQKARPPKPVFQALRADLDRTLRLAEAFAAGGDSSRSDKPLLGEIEAHQRTLEEARVNLLDAPACTQTPSSAMLAVLKATG